MHYRCVQICVRNFCSNFLKLFFRLGRGPYSKIHRLSLSHKFWKNQFKQYARLATYLDYYILLLVHYDI